MDDHQTTSSRTDRISHGATAGHNEDHVAIFHSTAYTDLVVLDGATSVADRDYVDEAGDVVWFVHAFAAALGPAIAAGLDQHAATHAAIDTVRSGYFVRANGAEIPPHAWPIAALTWIRATRDGMLHLYCLGDCVTLMQSPGGGVADLDPYVNPQEAVLQAEIAKLRAAGLDDPASRHARLLPMLRARREFQNGSPRPSILCLRPDGAFAARRRVVPAPAGAVLLAMTDGFYRLVDPYGLCTPASLLALCEEGGLETALGTLRAHEAGMAAGLSVKRADDASAVLWRA
ncbi:protein phosphatase 2C domain-containing protein [Pseudoduganella umbonata]|uniref:Protein phosphatase 2C domain-containing protein n=1 Tax=Pseudoduganella umbonata TaxID=864828 RepID=A0A4P8HQJ2_9BURK|nr:protein phosphatase 2C domain-containing protein [Pseudoduganella umbonata]MBB3221462.1 hypothetical protein [Pseudoduganella umbonata]QCP10615.1 hypothetical protein FCL38_09360 [Pseudoduganella umbonata]